MNIISKNHKVTFSNRGQKEQCLQWKELPDKYTEIIFKDMQIRTIMLLST